MNFLKAFLVFYCRPIEILIDKFKMKKLESILSIKLFCKLLIIYSLPIVVLVISFFLLKECGSYIYEHKDITANIIKPDSTYFESTEQYQNHNRDVLNMLLAREVSDVVSISSESGSLVQIRAIYAGIMGIMLAIFLNQKVSKKSFYVLALILITIFHGYDIHLLDLINRSRDAKLITSKSIDTLVNIKPSDSTWYNVDFSTRNDEYEALSKNSISRKILYFFFLKYSPPTEEIDSKNSDPTSGKPTLNTHVDLAHIVFYKFSLHVAYFLFTYTYSLNTHFDLAHFIFYKMPLLFVYIFFIIDYRRKKVRQMSEQSRRAFNSLKNMRSKFY